MKKTTILVATFAAAGAVAAAPLAGAETGPGPQTTELGKQADLVNGNVTQGWTVTGLKPSSDVIPYQPRGTLWEATATDQAVQGSAQPIVSNFNARAADGQTYRALFQVPTQQGVNPGTIAQGQQTSGKVYFDVVGAQPDSVVYNDGARDLLLWVQPAATPSTSGSGSTSSYPSSSYPSSSTPQGTGAAAAPAATGAEATTPGAPVPASSETAPVPAGSAGTPIPAGSTGTPVPAGSAGTPVPAGSAGTPIPAGTQGTPAAPAAPAPAPAAPAPAPAAPAPAPTAAPQPVSIAEVPHYQPAPTTTPVPLP